MFYENKYYKNKNINKKPNRIQKIALTSLTATSSPLCTLTPEKTQKYQKIKKDVKSKY